MPPTPQLDHPARPAACSLAAQLRAEAVRQLFGPLACASGCSNVFDSTATPCSRRTPSVRAKASESETDRRGDGCAGLWRPGGGGERHDSEVPRPLPPAFRRRKAPSESRRHGPGPGGWGALGWPFKLRREHWPPPMPRRVPSTLRGTGGARPPPGEPGRGIPSRGPEVSRRSDGGTGQRSAASERCRSSRRPSARRRARLCSRTQPACGRRWPDGVCPCVVS